jgi:hypothetical protein
MYLHVLDGNNNSISSYTKFEHGKRANSYTSMKVRHSIPSAFFTFIVWFGTIYNDNLGRRHIKKLISEGGCHKTQSILIYLDFDFAVDSQQTAWISLVTGRENSENIWLAGGGGRRLVGCSGQAGGAQPDAAGGQARAHARSAQRREAGQDKGAPRTVLHPRGPEQ